MRITFLSPLLLILVLQSHAWAADPAPDLSGRWSSGSWQSDASGHQGPLRATFRRRADGDYRVTFHERFWGVIPFVYGVTLHVTG